jgi:hypothetical protein
VNTSRVLAGLAVLAVLCGCSSAPSPKPTPTPTPTRSPSTSPCHADSVTPGGSPLTQILPSDAPTPSTITARARLTCGTTLNVTRHGAAVTTFGTEAICQLVRLGGVPVSTLLSREPKGSLFSLTAGQVWCRDLTSQPEQALICGMGPVNLTTINTQWTATCASDHVFHVAVYSGSVQVRYPKATKSVTLNSGRELVYDPATGQAVPSTIIFSAAEISIFSALEP